MNATVVAWSSIAVPKTSPDASHCTNVVLAVGWNGSPSVIPDDSAIQMKLVEPNGKQLGELPCIIFIGLKTRVCQTGRSLVREIFPHGGTVGDFSGNVQIVSKGIPHKDIIVHHSCFMLPIMIEVCDPNTIEKEGNSLPQLIWGQESQLRPNCFGNLQNTVMEIGRV